MARALPKVLRDLGDPLLHPASLLKSMALESIRLGDVNEVQVLFIMLSAVEEGDSGGVEAVLLPGLAGDRSLVMSAMLRMDVFLGGASKGSQEELLLRISKPSERS